jgi:SAM-dependent methyltransferase
MPNKFTYRSDEKELLDEFNSSSELLFKNLKELNILNRTTGGHAISLKGIKQLITDHHKTYHVVDLGCGSGDSLKAIAAWARRNNYKLRLTGVDINPEVIDYLKIHCSDYPEIRGVVSGYREYLHETESIDIVHCSLFCHHLSDDELLGLFIHFRQHIRTGFIINDLHRQWLAYYCAWLFPRLLNGTPLAKNDGPISVLRGFKYDELINLLKKANIRDYSLSKERLFRFLIVGKTEKDESVEG